MEQSLRGPAPPVVDRCRRRDAPGRLAGADRLLSAEPTIPSKPRRFRATMNPTRVPPQFRTIPRPVPLPFPPKAKARGSPDAPGWTRTTPLDRRQRQRHATTTRPHPRATSRTLSSRRGRSTSRRRMVLFAAAQLAPAAHTLGSRFTLLLGLIGAGLVGGVNTRSPAGPRGVGDRVTIQRERR